MRRKGRKKYTTFHDKTIAVFLSLDVQVRDEERAVLFTLPLVQLIPALALLWQLTLWLIRIGHFGFQILDSGFMMFTRWVSELQRQLNNVRLMLTVAEIDFKSALFGIGVPI